MAWCRGIAKPVAQYLAKGYCFLMRIISKKKLRDSWKCHSHSQAPLPRNEQEYEQALEKLNRLIDEVGTEENHPLLAKRFNVSLAVFV